MISDGSEVGEKGKQDESVTAANNPGQQTPCVVTIGGLESTKD